MGAGHFFAGPEGKNSRRSGCQIAKIGASANLRHAVSQKTFISLAAYDLIFFGKAQLLPSRFPLSLTQRWLGSWGTKG